jgi:maltoporin
MKKIRSSATPRAAVAAAALAMLAGSAHAVEWGGYFRAGPGASKKDASRACYGLNGPGLKYRLGNECDIYGEFTLTHGAKVEGVDYKALLMTNLYNPQTDTGDAKLGINQVYLEAKGYDVAPNTTFWMGKRFYGREDVHIVDTFFTNMSGVGAGFITPAGPGAVDVAWFKSDETATRSGNRLNLGYAGLPVNPNGKLRIVGTFTEGRFTGGESGTGLSVQHTQSQFFGGKNDLWMQVSQGSADLNSNFGRLDAPSSVKSWRIVDGYTWQAGRFGGQAMALYQNDKAAGVKTDSISVGGRISYAFTNNFKLLTEVGYSEKKPDGAPTQKLAKLTIAPTLSAGPKLFSRPELRLYVTTAKWNAAANAAAGAGGLTGVGDNATKGTSFGAQVEVWY